jgi:hypothetical protein
MRNEARKLFEEAEKKGMTAINSTIKMERQMHAFETRNKMDSQAVDMVPVLDKKLGKVLERFGQFNDRVSETLNKMEMLKNQCKNLEEKLTG